MPYPALQVDPVAAQDPDYLAFMRGAGYDETEILAELARKKGALGRQIDRAAPRFADQGRQALTNVQNDFTNRGLFRSGARMVNQVDATNEVRRNQIDFNAGVYEQAGDLQAQAQRDIAERRRQAADQALQGRTNAALAAANAQSAYTGLGALPGAPGAPSGGSQPPAAGPRPTNPPPRPAVVPRPAAKRGQAYGVGAY